MTKRIFNLFLDKTGSGTFWTSADGVDGTSSANGLITAINTPGLQPYTGDVLYTEFRSPISRSADQIEDVKLIIQF